MREHKTVTRTIENTIIVSRRCDVCGNKAPTTMDDDDWHKSAFYLDKIIVWREIGYSCEDGGESKLNYYDICPTCWEDKLVPFLESLGAKLSELCSRLVMIAQNFRKLERIGDESALSVFRLTKV